MFRIHKGTSISLQFKLFWTPKKTKKTLTESNCQVFPFLTHGKLKIKGVTFPDQSHNCRKHATNQEAGLLAYRLKYSSQNDSAYYFQSFPQIFALHFAIALTNYKNPQLPRSLSHFTIPSTEISYASTFASTNLIPSENWKPKTFNTDLSEVSECFSSREKKKHSCSSTARFSACETQKLARSSPTKTSTLCQNRSSSQDSWESSHTRKIQFTAARFKQMYASP